MWINAEKLKESTTLKATLLEALVSGRHASLKPIPVLQEFPKKSFYKVVENVTPQVKEAECCSLSEKVKLAGYY